MPGGHLAKTPHVPGHVWLVAQAAGSAVQEWGSVLFGPIHVAQTHSTSLEIISIHWQGQDFEQPAKRRVGLLPESQEDSVPCVWGSTGGPTSRGCNQWPVEWPCALGPGPSSEQHVPVP